MNMEAADGGRVKVLLPSVRSFFRCIRDSGIQFWLADMRILQPPQAHDVTATFVEIVGTVVDATTVKLLTCINLGSQLGKDPISFPPHDIIHY